MIIVIFLVFVALIVLGAILDDCFCCDGIGLVVKVLGVIGMAIRLLCLVLLLVDCSQFKVIDQKIEMYQEENTRIENQIAECVEQYQRYETEIITEVAPESAMTFVSLYPELKADALVSKQIEVYIDNNQKIKELKEFKISEDVTRWWLYFGKAENGD